MRRLFWLIAPFAVACGDKDSTDDPVDTSPELTDADGDGFFAEEDDCDDADAAVFPGAEEACDDVDQDCDALVDEGVLETLYLDEDGDGYGQDVEVEGCLGLEGYSDNRLDCDDADADVNQDATEICDGIDNDCDGRIDDDDEDVDLSSATTWYTDLDSDGFGDDTTAAPSCAPPANGVDVGGDCDDLRNGVNPDAEEECDGLDTDCDGNLSSDEEDADSDGFRGCEGDCDDASDTTYEGAEELCDGLDNDCSGAPLDEEADDDGDGWVECQVDGSWYGNPIDGGEDCDDEDASENPAADEVCDGDDDDCDGDVDEDDAIDVSTWYADSDGDTYGDALVSQVACDQPNNYVSDSSDCDDGDGDINPAAAEVCDGVDNDCDAGTSEDGMVTFTDSSGSSSDVSSSYSTSSSTVSSVTLGSDGTLTFCDGTFYVALDAQASVSLESLNEDASAVVLDGGGSGTPLSISTDGVSIELAELTLQNGDATNTYESYSAGGGLYCNASSSLDLTGVVVDGNEAEVGAGIFVGDDCSVTLDDVVVSSNAADLFGGGAAVVGEMVATDSTFEDNEGATGGGGVVVSGVVDLDGSVVDDNSATTGAGWVVTDGGELTCSGSVTATDGFTNNGDDYGAVVVQDGGFTADVCDFGTSSGGDDNSPADVYTALGNALTFDDDESFTCTDGLCDMGTFTFGDTTSSQSSNNVAVGVVIEASASGQLTSFGANLGGGCSTDFWVLQGSSASGPWTELASDTVTSVSGWNDISLSNNVGSGSYYAFVVGWSSCSQTAYSGASASTDAGFGTLYGDATQSSYAGGAPLSVSVSSTSTVSPIRVDVSL